MILSIVCPCLNEEDYIEGLLDFFIVAQPEKKELFLIDGGSSDQTIPIIRKYQEKYDNIKLLDNPDKIVPFALNKAIPLCNAEKIVRIDVHTKYASDYFEKIIETFDKVEADIVGGPTRTACKAPFQCAVAYAICTPFGVGNSQVHNIDYEGYSDSVTFGCWKKEIFEDVGMFDERLVRNQDDEFHYRAKSKGKKIYQNPEIKLWYYPRSNVKGLFRQYYQYGLYKPMVLRKVNSEIKLRHLIPSGFLLYFLSLPLAIFSPLWLIPLGSYLILDLIFAMKAKGSLKVKSAALLVYPTLHSSYGLGFLQGLFKKL